MQKPFKFIVECRFEQRVYAPLVWTGGTLRQKVTLKRYVEGEVLPLDYETYEAFERNDLLPSLYKLVMKIKNGKDAKAFVKQWVAQYGFLGCKTPTGCTSITTTQETLTDFLQEAKQLALLWQRYGQVTRRDLPALQEWIRFVPRPEGVEAELFWPKNAAFKTGYAPFDPPGVETLHGSNVFFALDDDTTVGKAPPVRWYQHAAVRYILYHIEARLAGARLFSPYYQLDAISPTEDAFTVTPVILCHSLLQAMYLQLYFLLTSTGTQTVCAACGVLFQPLHPNALYCSGTCYNTAKSRRFRGRKKIRGGKN